MRVEFFTHPDPAYPDVLAESQSRVRDRATWDRNSSESGNPEIEATDEEIAEGIDIRAIAQAHLDADPEMAAEVTRFLVVRYLGDWCHIKQATAGRPENGLRTGCFVRPDLHLG